VEVLSVEEDAELAQSATSSAVAREVLARRLEPRVRKLAAALLRRNSSSDADDATQLALLEILRAAPSYRGDSKLEAWADRIAVRTTIRFARERRLAAVRTAPDVDLDELPQRTRTYERLAEELARPILDYLDELPEARRTALVLRHAMGYSVEEIAELTGASVNTVKDRLLQGREQIRKMVRREQVAGRPR
jgi:RNA polymerase sigma-70 factor (ECF subfamily)